MDDRFPPLDFERDRALDDYEDEDAEVDFPAWRHSALSRWRRTDDELDVGLFGDAEAWR